MTRILVFSPYAERHLHTLYEGTIARACMVRGAEVEYLLCDGLLTECDQHWDAIATTPRPFDLCQRCRSGAMACLAELDLPYKWIGEYVSEAERRLALEWAQSLSLDEIPQANFQGYPLSEWVISSISSYFRNYPPDFDDWHTINVFRGFLYSAALVSTGLNNFLDSHPVDAAILFNGRVSATRVAFEILRMGGIRVLTHEKPSFRYEDLNVKENAHCISLRAFSEFWRDWGQVPLNRSQLEQTLNWLIDRRYNRNSIWVFNEPLIKGSSVRKILNIRQGSKLMALFTSSTDEVAGEAEYKGAFESQSQWVEAVVSWVKDRDDVELIIRTHPNLAGRGGRWGAFNEIKYFEGLSLNMPANVHLIMPDNSLNSYALMDAADIGLTFGSTVGVEMGMLGKPIILGSRAFYENGSTILTVRARQELPDVLAKSLQTFSSRELRREAFRLAYYFVFHVEELPFPLVSIVGNWDGKLNYHDFDALTFGKDKTLDHVCDFLLQGTPVHDSPTEAEQYFTTAEEDSFFAELEKSPQRLCDVNYERRVRYNIRLNQLKRSTKNILQHMPLGTGEILTKIGRFALRPLLR